MTKKNVLTVQSLIKPKTREVELEGGCVIIKQMSAGYALALKESDLSAFQLVSDMVVEPVITVDDASMMNVADVKKITDAILEFNGIATDSTELKNDQTEGSITS